MISEYFAEFVCIPLSIYCSVPILRGVNELSEGWLYLHRVSKDCSLGIWINMEEHIKLVTMRSDANIAEAFKCICINTLKVGTLSG